MSRRRAAEQRKVMPDPKYHDELIAKFTNVLMVDGKKSIARGILYNAMDEIGRREKEVPPLEVVKLAVEHVKPSVEVRPVRRQALAIRWLIQYASGRGGRSMDSKLAGELLDAYNNRGGAIRKKEDVHRMAEANRAFAHYRW